MRTRLDVPEDCLLEVATGDAVEIEKYIVAVVREILGYCQRPRDICPAITDKNGFGYQIHWKLKDNRNSGGRNGGLTPAACGGSFQRWQKW